MREGVLIGCVYPVPPREHYNKQINLCVCVTVVMTFRAGVLRVFDATIKGSRVCACHGSLRERVQSNRRVSWFGGSGVRGGGGGGGAHCEERKREHPTII